MDRSQTLSDRAFARATEAALLGRPVSERTFQVRLRDISGWPNPEMVVVPPGTFRMGEETRREVRINHAFALGKFEVTFAEWDAARASGAGLSRLGDQGWGRNNRPVINASWRDALAYIDWLNGALGIADGSDVYRLPSEAEWEFACRAGRGSLYSTGSKISTDQARFAGVQTAPVGSFEANAFGLHDMHGNVWEWCQDVWRDNLEHGPFDGSAWDPARVFCERVLRGGSWNSVAEGVRAGARNGDVPAAHRPWFGFRLARSNRT